MEAAGLGSVGAARGRSRRRALCWGFWAFHLTFCLIFVTWPAFRTRANPLWRYLRVYGAYTGASNAYGFFAPVVPNARRVQVKALCGERSIPVEIPLRGESRNRLTSITSLTSYRQIEQGVVASFGAYALGKYPCASAALVTVEYFAVPSMADYRRGERPRWKLLRIYPLTLASSLKAGGGRRP
ncbi:MAG: hypothetical protein RMK57_14480 [Bryobacterales bacterium]|nr:hypothetical protein [Bryobacteraceae bacterium]MDW8355727.1 hypothetical protein [Bryobacterales bacterium]